MPPIWVQNYAPGKLVIRRGADNGQVAGTANVSPGSGVPTASSNP